MIAYFVLGIGLLVGTLLLIKWFTDVDPRRVGRGLLWGAGAAALVLGVVLLWIGRYQFAWLVLPALAGLAGRWREILRLIRNARGAGGGPGTAGDQRSSTVETDFLRMTLLHDTGVMTGEVRAGQFAGERLEDLSLQACIALWNEIRAAGDEQSRQVLESYMDRVHGTGWRSAAGEAGGAHGDGGQSGGGGGARTGSDAMSPEEARAILGVRPDADADTIRAAYRRLMKQVHPDHGGSDYFAMKLNAARRVLLDE